MWQCMMVTGLYRPQTTCHLRPSQIGYQNTSACRHRYEKSRTLADGVLHMAATGGSSDDIPGLLNQKALSWRRVITSTPASIGIMSPGAEFEEITSCPRLEKAESDSLGRMKQVLYLSVAEVGARKRTCPALK